MGFIPVRILHKKIFKQECIPVGCVPSAALAVYPGGCLPHLPPVNRMTDNTGVKTFPCRNYVADGKKAAAKTAV